MQRGRRRAGGLVSPPSVAGEAEELLPRTRGDGPGDYDTWAAGALSSPHPRDSVLPGVVLPHTTVTTWRSGTSMSSSDLNPLAIIRLRDNAHPLLSFRADYRNGMGGERNFPD
jgi:hypothetical protein